MRARPLLVGLALAAAPLARAHAGERHEDAVRTTAALTRLGCTSCHLESRPRPYLFRDFAAFQRGPAPAATECAGCHVINRAAAMSSPPPGWLPLSDEVLTRVRRFHAYVDAPSLRFVVAIGAASALPRFTSCGLARFLSAPVPRSPAQNQSMFPLTPGARHTLDRALTADLEPCSDEVVPPDDVRAGARAFALRGCESCHAGEGRAPRLRLGMPLLGRAYFAARVRAGSDGVATWQRSWQVAGDTLQPGPPADALVMPSHADVSDAELRALYAYVSSDRSDLPAPRPAPPAAAADAMPEALKLRLFRSVQARVFDGSCRHCHTAERRDQRRIQQVFGATSDATPGVLPMSRFPTPSRAALAHVLGRDCATSPLLRRLRARAAEWRGEADAHAPRGMPLTLGPLPESEIRLVETWRAVGCPSDIGDLCEPCAR